MLCRYSKARFLYVLQTYVYYLYRNELPQQNRMEDNRKKSDASLVKRFPRYSTEKYCDGGMLSGKRQKKTHKKT